MKSRKQAVLLLVLIALAMIGCGIYEKINLEKKLAHLTHPRPKAETKKVINGKYIDITYRTMTSFKHDQTITVNHKQLPKDALLAVELCYRPFLFSCQIPTPDPDQNIFFPVIAQRTTYGKTDLVLDRKYLSEPYGLNYWIVRIYLLRGIDVEAEDSREKRLIPADLPEYPVVLDVESPDRPMARQYRFDPIRSAPKYQPFPENKGYTYFYYLTEDLLEKCEFSLKADETEAGSDNKTNKS